LLRLAGGGHLVADIEFTHEHIFRGFAGRSRVGHHAVGRGAEGRGAVSRRLAQRRQFRLRLAGGNGLLKRRLGRLRFLQRVLRPGTLGPRNFAGRRVSHLVGIVVLAGGQFLFACLRQGCLGLRKRRVVVNVGSSFTT
jgi:hypothetical protein